MRKNNHIGLGIVLAASSIILLLATNRCYYDSEEYLYPQIGGCDTTNVTFSSSVKSVLSNYCYGCHSNTTFGSGNGIKLEDYADVKLRADDGSLLGSMSHTTGYVAMPLGTPKLSECQIAVVQMWIASGATNN